MRQRAQKAAQIAAGYSAKYHNFALDCHADLPEHCRTPYCNTHQTSDGTIAMTSVHSYQRRVVHQDHSSHTDQPTVRFLRVIPVKAISHLEVPEEKIKEVAQVLKKVDMKMPVFAIEQCEYVYVKRHFSEPVI